MRGGRGAQLPRLGVTECSGGDQHPGFREDRQLRTMGASNVFGQGWAP